MGSSNSKPTPSQPSDKVPQLPTKATLNDQPIEDVPSKKAEEKTEKLKPCCACPETKKARDDCVLYKGEENCQDLIEKHRQCLRDLGFKV
ncbi:Cytochrome c oxidase copper chaperone [Tieghemiomyces parasiticus]|uniref:Cytochrome c oxidase copper chaperone n=1 Tax=Tieghemiomyces parasiticus TaxID=78921 RepID=A0A9W8E194_9FUNG|nr:Cytochrome c oxidase copper chaperone [Tieghemiomyces parasiticus]KAJ1928344.1 Cytochrome c oxidase copper chaperone [Tieghemiomyces parasiticus]